MKEDRDKDKAYTITPAGKTGKSAKRYEVSLDVIKSAYIASGMSPEEIAEQYYLPIERIKELILDHKLSELRKAYVMEGIQKIQSSQIQQVHKLMDIENNFKKLRIAQLEEQLEDYLAYYSRHGDFKKRHPMTGEVLKDLDGLPMYIHLPNVARELSQLKESVTLSEGMRGLLHRLDEIINTRQEETIDEEGADIIVDYKEIFGED